MYTLFIRDLFVFCTESIYNIMQWETFRILSHSSLLWFLAPQDQISLGKERQVYFISIRAPKNFYSYHLILQTLMLFERYNLSTSYCKFRYLEDENNWWSRAAPVQKLVVWKTDENWWSKAASVNKTSSNGKLNNRGIC